MSDTEGFPPHPPPFMTFIFSSSVFALLILPHGLLHVSFHHPPAPHPSPTLLSYQKFLAPFHDMR